MKSTRCCCNYWDGDGIVAVVTVAVTATPAAPAAASPTLPTAPTTATSPAAPEASSVVKQQKKQYWKHAVVTIPAVAVVILNDYWIGGVRGVRTAIILVQGLSKILSMYECL